MKLFNCSKNIHIEMSMRKKKELRVIRNNIHDYHIAISRLIAITFTFSGSFFNKKIINIVLYDLNFSLSILRKILLKTGFHYFFKIIFLFLKNPRILSYNFIVTSFNILPKYYLSFEIMPRYCKE